MSRGISSLEMMAHCIVPTHFNQKLIPNSYSQGDHFEDLDEVLRNPTDRRWLAVNQAILQGYTIDRIHELTRIDKVCTKVIGPG